MAMDNHHILLMSLPYQSHINPTLQLAKYLSRAGARVTFATTALGLSRLNNLPTLNGLSYAAFTDGSEDDTTTAKFDLPSYMAKLKLVGADNLAMVLQNLSNEDRPVSFLIYSFLLPWAATVARDIHVPSAFFAIQSATTFCLYHHFFNTHHGLYNGENIINPSISIELPGLPLLTCNDVPSFLFPSDPYYFLSNIFQEHIRTLEQDPQPWVLVNTFDALENASMKAIDNMNIISIGPLVPSAFSDGKDSSETSYGCDLIHSSSEYLQWFDSKSERSVIYVSFGSLAVLNKRQKEEILHGLMESSRPFLWVIRDNEGDEVRSMREKGVSEEVGFIVPWCSQMEVLCHTSIGCFITHCGWNSTLESLVAGVPVLGCPQFADQLTNIKMVEEVWGNGVRAMANEEGVVESEEIKRCLDILMGGGEIGDEIRRNAMKWKGLAMEAVMEGGSSHSNLKQFLETSGKGKEDKYENSLGQISIQE